MRLVKISDLTEEERKKAEKERKKRIEKNNKERQQLFKETQQKIDKVNFIDNPNKVTGYKNTSKNTNLWQQVQNIANSNAIVGPKIPTTNNTSLIRNTSKDNVINQLNKSSSIKLASQDEVKNAKNVNVKQMLKTQKDAKEGNILGYLKDKVLTGAEALGQNILSLYATDMMKNNERASKLSGDKNTKEKIDEQNDKLKKVLNNTHYQGKKSGISFGEKDFSNGVQMLGNASESVGNMLPSIALSTLNPSAGLALTGVSSAGSAMEQALDDGATPEQAQKVGVLKGTVEVATEKLFSGVKFFGKKIYGKGTLDDLFNAKILDKVSSKIGKFAVQQGYDIGGEVIEENISNIAGYGIDKLILDKDLPTFEKMLQDADETTKATVLSTILLKGLGLPTNIKNTLISNEKLTDTQQKEIDIMTSMIKENVENDIKNNNDNITVDNVINRESNVANNQVSLYNNDESEGDLNGQIQGRGMAEIPRQFNTRLQQNSQSQENKQYSRAEYEQQSTNGRRMVSNVGAIENNEQGGSTPIIEYTQRQDDGTGVRQNDISQKERTITEEYEDTESIKKVMEYAKKNKDYIPTQEIKTIQSKAKELGIPLNIYLGKDGNKHIGLTDGKEIYLDVNKNNTIDESGSLMDRFSHEVLHYIKRNNNTSFESTVNEIRDRIALENVSSIKKMIQNKGYDIGKVSNNEISYLAEEVLADYSAKHISGYDVDYGLPEDITYTLNTTLDDAITELKLKHNNQNVNTTINNNMQNNTKSIPLKATNNSTGETIQQVKLPTKENINNKTENINVNKIQNDITGDEKLPIGEKATKEKVAKILEQPIGKIKPEDRKWATFKANLLDKGIVFSELSRKTKNRELDAKWDATLSATSRGQNAIGNARYEFEKNTKTQKQISKSLEDIRMEVGDKTNEFASYMYHQLNIDRMTLEERFGGDTGINYERKNQIKNKPVFGDEIDAEYSRNKVAEYETKYPQFKSYAQDVYDFLDANKKELIDNGVISKELSDKFKEMYPHYVPISRVGKNNNAINVPLDTKRTGVNSPIKRAKGGNGDIEPLFQTIADRTLQTYKASARNSFGIELKNTLNSLNEYQQKDMQVADLDTIMEEMGNEQSNQGLLQEGKNGDNPTFTVFENGEKVTFDISKDMYDALKPISDSSILSKNSKILNKISNFRRGVLTEYNPLFLVTNSIKDAQDVLVNSQHTFKTYSKFPEAYAQIIKKGYYYNEYVQNGGEQNSYFKDGDFETNKKIPKSKKILTMPLEAISNVNNVIELAPRLAEYIASRENGASIDVAMLDASRVTTNFKAGGDVTKWANRNGATFLNASVQGAMQAARNIQEANMKGLKGWTVLACKAAIAGLPTIILNNLIWDDDEDYEELQDYVKDNYYCIAKYGDGKFIRIPKGRALATIQKVVSNADKYITGDREVNIDNLSKDFWEDISFAQDNLAPNNPLDNNVISPIIQAVTNRSWYGEDIVPSRLQKKPKAEQYDESIDSFSKFLGEKLNISPYKINYVLDQYGGGISDIVLPMMTKQAENNVAEDKFTTDSVMKSRYPGEFFNKVDELEINKNSSKATDEDVLKYKYINSISSDIGELYEKKRNIQSSDNTDKEKKQQLKVVQKQINELAKNSMENIEKIQIGNNTAIIGDKQYYKVDNEWKIMKDNKVEKLKDSNISLETYTDYENILQQKTEQKKKKEKNESTNLNNSEKMQILLDSSYSDHEKKGLYESEILNSSEDNFYNTILKDSDIDINEYLEYKIKDSSNKFSADKDKYGNSVSGSSKEKVYNYINKNITGYNNRLLLLAERYKLADSDRKRLTEYINSHFKGQDKINVFKKLNKNYKVSSNNKVYYK